MEAENTASDLDRWQTRTIINGFSGSGYLEFTGNKPVSGPVTSPLEYSFKINQSGLYYLHIHCAREDVVINGTNRSDVANDCFVKVNGDYGSGPNAGNNHQDDAPLNLLQQNTKFFGGANNKFTWAPDANTNRGRLDPGGHSNKRVALYDFKAGETYKLVISGRSQFFKVNRIMLRHINTPFGAASNLQNPESSLIDENLTTATGENSNDNAAPTITGELRQWHEVTLSLQGPASSETATPNPFLDYRLNVTFTHPASRDTFTVPGYFATDGDAAITHADSGNIWRAHISPSRTGLWEYSVSFRHGADVAISNSAEAGRIMRPLDGTRGSFTIQSSNKTGLDFRAPNRGLLKNRGGHFMTFASGDLWLKAGANIPENFMGYNGFDNTPPTGNNFPLRDWNLHVRDWNQGDPDWESSNRPGKNDGRGIIGALNYLAEQGTNSFYFIAMNVKGDTNETFPMVAPQDREHFDISKMDQWNIALTHANSKGIYINAILGETENGNENFHDNGKLGRQRKLYYRMMIARFGHLPALEWGIGEESDFGDIRHREFAGFIKSIDSYDHPLSVETRGGRFDQQYNGLLGLQTFDNTAFQGGITRGSMQNLILEWKRRSANAGAPWVLNFQEPQGIQLDNEDLINGLTRGRRDMMWPLFMSTGAGFEWYVQEDGGVRQERDPVTGRLFGHRLDLMLGDLRKLEGPLKWNGHAIKFFEPLPLNEMTPSYISNKGSNTYVLGKENEVYAVYNDRNGRKLKLDLRGATGNYQVRWFDPRNGGAMQKGTIQTVSGGAIVSLGNAPNSLNQDWAVLVSRANKEGND